MLNLIDSSGAPVRLGPALGSGGEGRVYEVVGRPNTVAKVYHQPLSADRAEKIRRMARINSPSLLMMTAWPTDLVTSNGKPSGLLMPKVSGFKDIHKLYSPKSRKAEYPNANFRFLVAAAANVARAFATVHTAGAVVGDVNHGGVVVADNATVKLIDCDSFQFAADGKTYYCEVGVPTFTPPELQNRSFRGILRTPNHDNFGLAVLIFHLLFLGRHPFAGRFLGRGDMPIESAIQQDRFAYGGQAHERQMQPPPHVPALASISSEVAVLFEAAFSVKGINNGARPAASDWIQPLETLEKNLKTCAANSSHLHSKTVSRCPWCAIENATGMPLFNLFVLPTIHPAHFDIQTVWRTIEGIKLISPPQPILIENLPLPKPSAEAVKLKVDAERQRGQSHLGIAVVIVAVVALSIAIPGGIIWWLLGGGYFINQKLSSSAVTGTSVLTAARSTAENNYAAKHVQYASAQRSTSAVAGKFHSKKAQLQTQRDAWHGIPAKRAKELQKLEQQRRQQQLDRFLERFFLETATIPGIGPGRKATLESYGIETASDLEYVAITNVPGFGPAMARKLLDWRKQVERDFRFDSTKPIDPQQIAVMDQALNKEKKTAEQALVSGASELIQIKRSVELQYSAMRHELEESARQLAQARADAAGL